MLLMLVANVACTMSSIYVDFPELKKHLQSEMIEELYNNKALFVLAIIPKTRTTARWFF